MTTSHGPFPQQRRTLVVLVAAQVLSGAGLAAGITVGALLAQDMLGSTSLAGVPSALFTAGSAAAAVLVGHLSHRYGRRIGLVAGYLAGAAGSVGVVAAAVTDSIPLLFTALLVYGAGTATNLQARYAGADLSPVARRARAIAVVLVATTLGAVVGPNLVEVMGGVALHWGIPALAGPFLLSAAAYAAAGLVLWVWLRPDPLLLARSRQERPDRTAPAPAPRRPATRWLVAGTVVMVLSQAAMVAIMTMTPVHMRDHGHDVGAAGLVIAVHAGAMFLPSPLTGQLVDRVGRASMAVASGVVLLLAGLAAAVAPTGSVAALAVALGLLGLGWNLGLVSGTAMVTDALPVSSRARAQGVVDLCIAVAGAGGGLTSGLVVASGSFTVLAVGGGLVALAIVPVVVVAARTQDRDVPPVDGVGAGRAVVSR